MASEHAALSMDRDTAPVAESDAEGSSIGVGAVLAGKYRLDAELGRGGMGVVHAATHLGLHRRVAVKLLRDPTADPTAVERFMREARALAQLDHRNVARILDVATLDGGEPYLVLELLEGADLATVLWRRGRLPVGEAVALVAQACAGVAAAHALGIVHRDLKPANLFLTAGSSPCVKVIDFGVAKAPEETPVEERLGRAAQSPTLTSSSVLGSRRYMSPEQIRNASEVDARSDVWSLGVILVELITGELPDRASMRRGARLAASRGAPRWVAAVIARCLADDPADRFPDAAALGAALRSRRFPRLALAAVAALGLVAAWPQPALRAAVGIAPPAPPTIERGLPSLEKAEPATLPVGVPQDDPVPAPKRAGGRVVAAIAPLPHTDLAERPADDGAEPPDLVTIDDPTGDVDAATASRK